MTKYEMFKKIKELFRMIEELANYALYSHEEKIQIKNQTLENFNRIWGIKK